MKFTQFKKQDEVRDTLILEMMKNKIRKNYLFIKDTNFYW